MKASKPITLSIFLFIALLLINLGWMVWNWHQNSDLRAITITKWFKAEILHTNDISPWPYLAGNPSAIGVVDVKSGQPIWTKWICQYGEDADIEGYYFHGKHLFDVYSVSNYPLVYNVYFRGPGKSVTWWRNRGGADTFTERAFYDTNGILFEDQVWYSNTWYNVNVQNGANGIVINGQWHQLAFDTNGMWTIETQSDAP